MRISSPTTCSKHGSLQSLTTSFSILHCYTPNFPKYREPTSSRTPAHSVSKFSTKSQEDPSLFGLQFAFLLSLFKKITSADIFPTLKTSLANNGQARYDLDLPRPKTGALPDGQCLPQLLPGKDFSGSTHPVMNTFKVPGSVASLENSPKKSPGTELGNTQDQLFS